MPEHVSVSVDEVVLLQRVQNYGDGAIEHLSETGVRISEMINKVHCENVFTNDKLN